MSRILDSHAHIFPQKIADKATRSIGDFYAIPMQHRGSPEALLESGARIHVEKYVVCSTATKPEQVKSINYFIVEQCALHPEFVGLATLHPGLPDLAKEIERIASMGLHGVKLHPDFQHFDIDAPEALPMYEALEPLALPVLLHTGDDRYDYSAPGRLARVAKRFPKLPLIGAHFGGYRRWSEADVYEDCPNVYFDTCSSLPYLDKDQAVALIRRFGAHRFMFGTDFPMWDHVEEYKRFCALPLTQEEREQIEHGTMERLYPFI